MTPCTICGPLKKGEKRYQLYDFTDEAVAVIESMKTLNQVGLIYVSDLYRGSLSKKASKQKV